MSEPCILCTEPSKKLMEATQHFSLRSTHGPEVGSIRIVELLAPTRLYSSSAKAGSIDMTKTNTRSMLT